MDPGTLLCLLAMTSAPGARSPDGGGQRKQAVAVRVPAGSIRIDGVLDDRAWGQAVPITDFIQKEPDEGAAPTQETEVRVVYDEDALYVAARMHNRGGVPIQAPMGRRDEIEEQAEYFLVSLDTFLDRRTAYSFGVSATGVRMDRFHPRDDETEFDEDFNPVWRARTHLEGESWTAELWIPFSQLRWSADVEQTWGMNLQRFAPSRNEMVYWSPVPRTVTGWASRFGDLLGLEALHAGRRIEVLPYVGGAATSDGDRDPRNPFDDGRNLSGRTGLDAKVGIGPNLTLDATFNPDFGQVEADPSEVNLTANETFFDEKRPFFTEGARLLNLEQASNFFYSRRIGARPETAVAGDFVDYPKQTTILGAAKLTGRLRSGTSLGMLAAVTGDSFARVSNLGSPRLDRIRVAPRTAYGLVRVQQEFGAWGSTAGVMATAVHRDLEAGDPLAALLARNAFGGAADTVLRFRNGQYEVRSFAGFTLVNGEAEAMAEIQRSSAHYFQRPDRTYWRYDPTRTSMAGYKAGVAVERTGGRHWLWSSDVQVETPGFEANDIGRLNSADGIMLVSDLRYRETVPGKRLRNYSLGLEQTNDWNRAGHRQAGTLRGVVDLTFPNFWTAELSTGPDFRTMSTTLTRGGPLMGGPAGWTTVVTLRNRAAARTVWMAEATATRDELGGRLDSVTGSLSLRAGVRWQLSLAPTWVRQTDSRQYVTTLGGGRPETYGQRYVFSSIDRSTVSTQLRVGFTPRPDVNIDLYAEPFAASGRYYDFGELPVSRARDLRATEFTAANLDFDVRSFRSNLVLRWEWRPGSTVHLVWQQDRRARDPFAGDAGLGDMLRSLRATGSDYFVAKVSFWAPFD